MSAADCGAYRTAVALLTKWGRPLSAQNKLRLGLFGHCGGVCDVCTDARAAETSGKLAMRNLVFLNLLLAVGELCGPGGDGDCSFDLTGKRQGLGMGLWFLVVALANWLAGQLGRLSTDSRSAIPMRRGRCLHWDCLWRGW